MASTLSYLALARIDNWTKNLVVFVGTGIAYILSGVSPSFIELALVMASVCFASSANYVLNELLDVRSDGFHPIKKKRSPLCKHLNNNIIILEYMAFAIIAATIAWIVSTPVFAITAFYLACAWLYNIRPVRLKDIAYVDAILESINYPIRILLGWLCVLPNLWPPSSLIIICWSLGAFVMSIKRLAEYQLFESPEQATAYRRSYRHYSVSTLTVCAFIYGLTTVFGLSIFLPKYKLELILLLPFFIIWMGWYFLMGVRKLSCVIYPEKLILNRPFMIISTGIFLAAAILINTTIPELRILREPLKFENYQGKLP